MMPRPMVLVFLLLILVFTSHFDWKQQLENVQETSPTVSQKQNLNKEEVKEKIILSQEKNIQQLNKLVQSLQQQLLQCHGSRTAENYTGPSLTVRASDVDRQQILED